MNFIISNIDSILECLFLSSINKPPIINEINKFKTLIPDFLNFQIEKKFSNNLLKIVEDEGKPYDWIIYENNTDIKISVKTTIDIDIFPRKKIYNSDFTKGKPIILYNCFPGSTLDNKKNDFDFLLLFINNNEKDIYGTYLFEKDYVIKNLDSKKQSSINFIPRSKNESYYFKELDQEKINYLKQKYLINIDKNKHNNIFIDSYKEFFKKISIYN